jgi:hypothetical protein
VNNSRINPASGEAQPKANLPSMSAHIPHNVQNGPLWAITKETRDFFLRRIIVP